MPTFSSKLSSKMGLPFKKKAEIIKKERQLEPQKQQTKVTINPIVAQQRPYEDSVFFNDKRCQHRALFMSSQLKEALDGIINPIRPSSSYGAVRESPAITLTPSYSTPTCSQPKIDRFWRTVAHRLYTLNYILFVLPSNSQSRADFLNRVEANLSLKSDGQELFRKGGMEAHFAIRYVLEHRRRRRKTLLEDAFELEKRNGGNVDGAILPETSSDEARKNDQYVELARKVIEQCLDAESKVDNSEKDAMYVHHAMKSGLYNTFELRIELEEDRNLRHRLKRLVDQNKPNYENPFEDQDLIVLDDDDYKSSRQVDSGFYDDWPNVSNNSL